MKYQILFSDIVNHIFLFFFRLMSKAQLTTDTYADSQIQHQNENSLIQVLAFCYFVWIKHSFASDFVSILF